MKKLKVKYFLLVFFLVSLFAWPFHLVISGIQKAYIVDASDRNFSKEKILANFSQRTVTKVEADETGSVDQPYQITKDDSNSPELAPAVIASTKPPSNNVTRATSNFYINIEKINLTHDIEKNVDASERDEYLPILEKRIAHGDATALPPKKDGNVYLFAHSKNDYTSITPKGGWFTRLDELVTGDQIEVFYEGEKFVYVVQKLFVVDPDQTGIYTPHSPYEGKKSLTLQTCFPRGDTSQRLIISAVEI